jgi:putative spermidine/putrescine transport system permease protein
VGKNHLSKGLWLLYGLVLAVFLMAPVLVTALYSVSDARYFAFPVKAFSLRWYVEFFGSSKFIDAALNSVLLAAVVTPVSLLLALPTAHALARLDFPGRKAVEALILSPLVVPGVVTGVAFLSFFRMLHQDLGMVRMAVAMLVVTFPFALRALAANYGGMDRYAEEAARDLGCGPVRTYLKVTLPQLKAGSLAGAIFVFSEVIDNFAVNVFLVDLDSTTLPIAAYQHIRDFDDPLIAVMSTLLSLVALGLVIVFGKFAKFDRYLR